MILRQPVILNEKKQQGEDAGEGDELSARMRVTWG
jgi:hypothetical protein